MFSVLSSMSETEVQKALFIEEILHNPMFYPPTPQWYPPPPPDIGTNWEYTTSYRGRAARCISIIYEILTLYPRCVMPI